MVIKGKNRIIFRTLPILFRVSGPSIKQQNWALSPEYHVVFDETLSTVEQTRKGKVPGNWNNLIEEHSELTTQEKFTLCKIVAS